jgi:RNA polymerase sigma factor (TIGR02999 family)
MNASNITVLIADARQGNAEAENRLCACIYDELHAMARRIMPHDDTSLQPTMLIGDLFEKLFRKNGLKKTENRRYFFTVAANQMRNMLVDHYRRKKNQKRGGDRQRESLDVVLDNVLDQFESRNDTDIDALNRALEQLRNQNPRQHQVVMYRFFGGLTIERIAELLGISKETAGRDWNLAKKKLYADLYNDFV